MQINTIIKRAVKRLELEGKLLTPDFYAEAFCKEAQKAGVQVEDCNHLSKFQSSLSKELQKEIKNYRIQTLQELTRFLVGKLNRANPTQCAEILDSQIALTKTILKAIARLHNLQAEELAKKSQEMLLSSPTLAQIDYFKQLWENFISTYDDTFLETLRSCGDVDTHDLEKTIKSIQCSQAVTQENPSLEKIAQTIISSLKPSISSRLTKEIENTTKTLQTSPEKLLEDSFEEQIKQAIKTRIALDKKSVQEMVASLESVLDKLSIKLIDMIEKSDGSTIEIQKIKKELENYTKVTEANFVQAHKQLYTIALTLEENTLEFRNDLQDHSNDVTNLQKKVKELEEELKKAKEEAKIDFLTKLYNKRALEEFLTLKEGEFKRHGRNFSIIMFDLDHFKKVNDTYGHDAGDIVLKAFATILKKSSRDIDIVGRFGGEEFIAILGDTDLEGAIRYAQKVRAYVEKAKFMYKGKQIPITVSGGVAERQAHISVNQTIKKADENLYKAKNNGRNQIAY